MPYTIYLRTNLVNGKQYVGQTRNFKQREYNWHNLNWGYAGKCIDAARKKYGTENFDTEILRECKTQEELNEWEMYYIKELNTKVPNGYNLTDGGEGSIGCIFSDERRRELSEKMKGKGNAFYGKHHSEETKAKLSKANKGRKHSEEAKQKMKGRISSFKGKHHSEEAKEKLRKAHLGTHLSEETKRKLSEKNKGENNYMYGKHHTEETIRKISEAMKGKMVGENNPMYGKKRKGSKLSKKVYQYTLEGELINVFNSIAEAARELGLKRTAIRDCCNGGRFMNYKGERKWYNCNQHGGYIWRFEEKMLSEQVA